MWTTALEKDFLSDPVSVLDKKPDNPFLFWKDLILKKETNILGKVALFLLSVQVNSEEVHSVFRRAGRKRNCESQRLFDDDHADLLCLRTDLKVDSSSIDKDLKMVSSTKPPFCEVAYKYFMEQFNTSQDSEELKAGNEGEENETRVGEQQMTLDELENVVNGIERLELNSTLLTTASSRNYDRLLDDQRTYYIEQDSSDGVDGVLKKSSEIIPSTVTTETLWNFVLDVQPDESGNFGNNRGQTSNNFPIKKLYDCWSSYANDDDE